MLTPADARILGLEEPGLEIRREGQRIVFRRTLGPGGVQVVAWRVTDAEVSRLAAAANRDARAAFGASGHGMDLLVEHVREAILTFDGEFGEIEVTAAGLRVIER